jgi:hypothetical protein
VRRTSEQTWERLPVIAEAQQLQLANCASAATHQPAESVGGYEANVKL